MRFEFNLGARVLLPGLAERMTGRFSAPDRDHRRVRDRADAQRR